MDGLFQQTWLLIFTSLLHLILLALIVLCSGKKSDSSSVAPTQNTGETASPKTFWDIEHKSRKKARKREEISRRDQRQGRASTDERPVKPKRKISMRSPRKKRGIAQSTQVTGSEKETIHI
ncbi:unnamed protein product [Caenorhabditis brenneri]